MKRFVKDLDATPAKRLFRSIIADYDLDRAICELADNAIDAWSTRRNRSTLKLDITLDEDQQSIDVLDNAGGIEESSLRNVVSPGETGNDPANQVIGIFGVGTKRAVIALAEQVQIRSRHLKENTHLVEFDDHWLNDNENWTLPYYRVDDIDPGATLVQLQRLRFKIDGDAISGLVRHLSRTYAKFIEKKSITIFVNNEELKSISYDCWSYPPKYEPKNFKGRHKEPDGRAIDVEIVGGLADEASPSGDYGVYFYCNDRLIASAIKSYDVGFGTHLAGKPHPSVSLMRVIVSLRGSADLMPWNSSKSDISYNHPVFRLIREPLTEIVAFWAKTSRAFEGSWEDKVYPHEHGPIDLERLPLDGKKKLHLPPTPKSRPRYADIAAHVNKTITKDRPWTRGLVSGIIASDFLFKKNFDEKNRITLIVLDSTLEIGFKEYLVNESGQHYSDKRLLEIFSNRNQVHEEIKKIISISDKDWKKVNHYYGLRCKFIHQRASVDIPDKDIEDYRMVVEKILNKMFRLKFRS